jgi:formylglycine-generating enzyme required for sulfatase activity
LAAKDEREEIERVISALSAQDARLVTTNSAAGFPNEPVVEISHEALIRGWARLKSWIEESREGLRIQRQLTAAVAEWQANGRNESFLFSGAKLARAEEWSESNPEDINDDEREFIEASREHDARGRRLSDSATLDQLEASAKQVWLDIPKMRIWLNRARTVVATFPEHKRHLEKFKQEIETCNSGEVADSDDTEVRRWYDTVGVFVSRLELFDHTLKAAAEHVVNVSANLKKLTLEDARDEWENAIDTICDMTLSPQYGGLRITPQIGLIPIGPDPVSRLWEFGHLPTGVLPLRNSEGKLLTTEEMGVVLILIPGGTFRMGAVRPGNELALGMPNVDPYARDEEQPLHSVTLEPFFISKFQMTQGQWLRSTGTNLSAWKTQFAQGTKYISLLHPIEFVSWNECTQALQSVGLSLPTEAQWEYAARAGTSTIWWNGNDSDLMTGAANLLGCREPIHSFASPSIVGLFDRPNGFGLHDVSGNVWEWCRDPFGSYELEARPGTGARIVSSAKSYVCRGGSFFNTVEYGRSAVRYYQCPPDSRFNNLGFRPGRALET